MSNEKGPGKGPIAEEAAATSDMRVTPPLAHALAYAARGWRVLPLKPGSKVPLIKDWPNRATTDTATIAGWFKQWPTANVGIATGPASGIWALDIDDKNNAGGSATLAALERAHGNLPETWTVGTPSLGVHHYFAHEGLGFDLGNSAGKLGPGLDVRATGGYVAAPPSRVDGRPYIVLIDAPIAAAPAWLVDQLRDPHTHTYKRSSDPHTHTYERPTGGTSGLLAWLARAEPGGQDDKLCWVVRVLRDDGLSPQDAGDLLWPVLAAWPCSGPPWTHADIERHLSSAYRGGVTA